jgi:hypothetical protein
LVFIRWALRQEPLIAMGFRFRRSTRLGPLRFNYRFAGLRLQQGRVELDLRWRAGRFVQHPRRPKWWCVEHAPDRPAVIPAGRAEGLPNSRRLRPGQLDALMQQLLEVLRQELFAPGSAGALLWNKASVSRLLADGTLSARTAGLLAVIETPEAMEGYVLRAQGQDDAKRRAQRCITAVQEVSRLVISRGW